MRIVIASAFIALAIYVFVELGIRPAMPALQFNWLGAFFRGLAVIPILLTFFVGVHVAILPQVSVSAKRVAIQHGQWVRVFKHDDIKAVHFVFRSNGRHFMRVETAKSNRRVGLSSKVSLDTLAEHLGDKMVVHDRRRRAHGTRQTGDGISNCMACQRSQRRHGPRLTRSGDDGGDIPYRSWLSKPIRAITASVYYYR